MQLTRLFGLTILLCASPLLAAPGLPTLPPGGDLPLVYEHCGSLPYTDSTRSQLRANCRETSPGAFVCTWRKKDLHIVTCQVFVNGGSGFRPLTLEVEPGAVVYFRNNGGLLIENDGVLKLHGTATQRIHFRGDSISQRVQWWREGRVGDNRISYLTSNVPLQPDVGDALDPLRLQHLSMTVVPDGQPALWLRDSVAVVSDSVFQGPTVGGRFSTTAISASHASVEVLDSVFRDFEYSIHGAGPELTVRRSIFRSIYSAAIDLQGFDDALVENCVFFQPDGFVRRFNSNALRAQNNLGRLTFRFNTIYGNGHLNFGVNVDDSVTATLIGNSIARTINFGAVYGGSAQLFFNNIHDGGSCEYALITGVNQQTCQSPRQNFSVEPRFRAPEEEDFRLSWDSQLFDIVPSSFSPGLPNDDSLGNPRVGRLDVGAFETPVIAPTPLIFACSGPTGVVLALKGRNLVAGEMDLQFTGKGQIPINSQQVVDSRRMTVNVDLSANLGAGIRGTAIRNTRSSAKANFFGGPLYIFGPCNFLGGL